MLARARISGLILAVTLVGSACGTGPALSGASPAARENLIKVVPATRSDISRVLTYGGDVRSRAALTILPRGTGRVEKILVDVGSSVRAGDTLIELDKEQALLAVRQAEASSASARARLAGMKAGARAEQVAQAEGNARAARSRYESLKSGGRTEQIAQANANLSSAQQRLDSLKSPRPEALAQADAAVASAEARLTALEKGPSKEQIRAAEIGVEGARNALYSVQLQRDSACGRGGGFACDGAQSQVLAAEASVRQAEQQLTIVKLPPTPETVAQAKASVEIAREQAKIAREPLSSQDLAATMNVIRQAESAVSLARNPGSSSDLEGAKAQAEAAEAAHRLAMQPFTAQDNETAEAQLIQAEAQVEIAKLQVKELTIVAPIAGVVSERLTALGALASPQTPLLALIGSDVEISLTVEEAQIGRLKTSQGARITVSSLGGPPITGKVSLIAPTVDPRTRSAIVKVVPDQPGAAMLRPGMFAQVAIDSERRNSVLVVPKTAITTDGSTAVFVVAEGGVRRVPIQVGLQDRDVVEVLSGLSDGDQVAVDGANVRDGDRVEVAKA